MSKTNNKEEKVHINKEDFGTLCVCAIRYCHGRKTYMPSLVREIIQPHLEELSDKDIKVLYDDCEYQQHFDLYGDDSIDKPGWLEWKDLLKQEMEKRGHIF